MSAPHPATLLDQQFWCWGRDVRHPSGNLLTRYGFRRIASEDPAGTSSYAHTLSDERRVGLRRGSLVYGEARAGALMIWRGAFVPRLVHWERHAELPADCYPDDAAQPEGENESRRIRYLQAGVALWISSYESWIADVAGPGYRDRCADEWPRSIVSGRDLGAAWADYVSRIAGKPAHGH